jgi:hypothetical protein
MLSQPIFEDRILLLPVHQVTGFEESDRDALITGTLDEHPPKALVLIVEHIAVTKFVVVEAIDTVVSLCHKLTLGEIKVPRIVADNQANRLRACISIEHVELVLMPHDRAGRDPLAHHSRFMFLPPDQIRACEMVNAPQIAAQRVYVPYSVPAHWKRIAERNAVMRQKKRVGCRVVRCHNRSPIRGRDRLCDLRLQKQPAANDYHCDDSHRFHGVSLTRATTSPRMRLFPH